MKITVVDSIMGSGKTQKAIKMMSEQDGRFIYITPFLSEIKRIKESVKNKTFYEPIQKGEGKLKSFKQLIKDGKNIASTHSLFSTADDEIMDLLKINDYTLILDEVMDVVTQVFITEDDLNMLINDKKILIGERGEVSWNEKDKNYNGDFSHIKIMAQHDRLIMANNNLMLWMFPVDVFNSFSNIYILTYMFKGQVMKYYYDLYNMEYEYISVKNGEFVEYTDDKESIVILINIFNERRLNLIGEENYSLSYSWYVKSHKSFLDILKNNITNFFRNKMNAKSKEVLWTTFLGDDDCIRKYIQNKGYQSQRCFAPINARATNEYGDRKYVAYTVNRFMNPYLKSFFKSRNIDINEDEFALSEMLQFIFRSAIRNNEKITLYIPSKRMRYLLKNWMEK